MLNRNAKLATKILPTEIKVLDFPKLRGYIKDLIGDAGYQATAEDFFDLVYPGTCPGFYEKVLIEVNGDSPIQSLALCKLGPKYLIMASKANKTEFNSRSATTIINLVEDYKPSEESINLETLKGKNYAKLLEAIEKAEKEKGRNANVKNVLHHLIPGVKIGCGRYKHVTPNYEIWFNGFLGQMIAEIIDNTGFKRSVTNARELRAIIS